MSKKKGLLLALAIGSAAAIALSGSDDDEQPQQPYNNGYPYGYGQPGHPYGYLPPHEEEAEWFPEEEATIDPFARPDQTLQFDTPNHGGPGAESGMMTLDPNFQINFEDPSGAPVLPQWKTSELQIRIEENKDQSIFRMFAPTAAAARRQNVGDRKLILIDTWESYHYFGRMLASSLLMKMSGQPNPATSRLLEWFRYHDWKLHPSGEVKNGIINSLRRVSGRFEPRLWPFKADGDAGNWNDISPQQFIHMRSMPKISQSKAQNVVGAHDGLTYLLEYACARCMSISMAQSIVKAESFLRGKVGPVIASGITDGVLAAMKLNKAISQHNAAPPQLGAATAIAAAAAAAAAALAKIATGIGNEIGHWESMRAYRRRIGSILSGILIDDFNVNFKRDFSGHKWGLIVPPYRPIHDVQDELWQYYLYSTPGRINVGPQHTCYYLGLNFNFAWSIACADHSLVVLFPRVSELRIPRAWAMLMISQAELASNPNALDMDVRYDPAYDIPATHGPPQCWPNGPEQGWMGGPL